MSLATAKMKEEIKNDLCKLLNIPGDDSDGTMARLIDKIMLCATLETMETLKVKKSFGEKYKNEF